MTVPLMVLAVGAIVAGFVSIPPALGGGAALEHFLEPSFTAHATRAKACQLQRPKACPEPRPLKRRTKSRIFRMRPRWD